MQDQRFEIMEMPNAWQGRSLTCLSVRGPLSQKSNVQCRLCSLGAEVAAVALIRPRGVPEKVGEETDDGGRAPARYFLLP